MREDIDRLWYEYFSEECAQIDSMEEKAIVKKVAEMHKTVDDLLTNEQRCAVEKYIEVMYELQGYCIKKAFFKGCKFTVSFFFAQGK